MKKGTKKAAVILLFIAFFAFIGYVYYKSCFSKITEIDTTSSIGELYNHFLNLISILVTAVLGVCVYFQSERIHNLESAKYDIFLGAEKTATEDVFPEEIFHFDSQTLADNNKVKIFETAHDSEFALFVNVFAVHDCGITIFPVDFVTRNAPLITRLMIKEILLTVDYRISPEQDLQTFKKKYSVDADPINRIFPDQSHFMLNVVVHGIERETVEQAEMVISFMLEDQLGRSHSVSSSILLVRAEKHMCLLSSKSNCKLLSSRGYE